MYVIGLTGGIASGKSTASRRLREMGAALVDTDIIAHELAQPGEALWQLYTEHFGVQVLHADRTLDRAAIARQIFTSSRERAWMDRVAHPLILAECQQQLTAFRDQGCPSAVLDAPLLLEVGWDAFVDEVWLVAAVPKIQLRRLMERDSLSRAEAVKRMAAQLSLAEKSQRADLILDNNGTMEQLLAQVDQAWHRVMEQQGG